jgi:hypothetical protein
MTDLTGRHAAKHTRKRAEIDPTNASVQLSDNVRKRFEDLYLATCDKGCTFDPHVHVMMKLFSSFSEPSVRDLVQELPKIVLETERWAVATGNLKARDALKGVLEALGAEKSFMLVKNPPNAHRQA